MTYSILLALGSSCFGLLFLGSGSTFGSNTSTRFPCDCRAIRAVRYWSTTDDPAITSTGLNVQLSRLSSPRYLERSCTQMCPFQSSRGVFRSADHGVPQIRSELQTRSE